jgi:hypothetical protein
MGMIPVYRNSDERYNVVCVDNLARENVADKMIMCGLHKTQAQEIADLMNKYNTNDMDFYKTFPVSQRLSRGMEDLV